MSTDTRQRTYDWDDPAPTAFAGLDQDGLSVPLHHGLLQSGVQFVELVLGSGCHGELQQNGHGRILVGGGAKGKGAGSTAHAAIEAQIVA